ncbi:MAG TPA: ribosomal protein S18-alanine N-acetyltransferase [Capsulimonadaceae bacterium]|nr:ribosomal protein S18-alanine N-acetyltransferase [Capsulimonadaceae bacterium]
MIRMRDPSLNGYASGGGDTPLLRIHIGPMRLSDIEGVSKLERRCYTLPWSSSAYVTEINNANAHYIVAKTEDGGLVGYGGIWVIMDELHVTTLAVDPSARGRKVGERMLIVLMEEGIRRGAARATLEVRQSNRVAQQLYRKYGFQEVAMRRSYYSDNGENAVIMWAEELRSPGYQQTLHDYKQHLFFGRPAAGDPK